VIPDLFFHARSNRRVICHSTNTSASERGTASKSASRSRAILSMNAPSAGVKSAASSTPSVSSSKAADSMRPTPAEREFPRQTRPQTHPVNRSLGLPEPISQARARRSRHQRRRRATASPSRSRKDPQPPRASCVPDRQRGLGFPLLLVMGMQSRSTGIIDVGRRLVNGARAGRLFQIAL